MSETLWDPADTQPPGTRVRGRLPVPGLPGGIPATRVRGAEPGPALLVTAGVHGGEYCGIEAAIQFANALDPAALRGEVTILALVNRPAFYAKRQYVVPEDGLNLNRVFPGRADGSLAERLAYAVMAVAKTTAHWVDLHSGDLHEALWPFVIYSPDGSAPVAQTARRMAEAYGIPVLVESPALAGGTYQAGTQAGIAAILAESGQMGQLEPAGVARHVAGLQNVCRMLGLIPEPAQAFETTTYTQNLWVRSPRDALQHPQVRVGQAVQAGAPGTILTDEFGEVLDRIAVPHDGRVLFHATSLAINEGDPLFAVVAP